MEAKNDQDISKATTQYAIGVLILFVGLVLFIVGGITFQIPLMIAGLALVIPCAIVVGRLIKHIEKKKD